MTYQLNGWTTPPATGVHDPSLWMALSNSANVPVVASSKSNKIPDAFDFRLAPDTPENMFSILGRRSQRLSYMSRTLKSFSGDL
jgi:hypothetical protein